jgi:hypothetical protein
MPTAEGSGSGLGRRQHPHAHDNHPTGDRGGPAADEPAPERFSVIITVVDPRAPDWVRTPAWGDRLQPNGVLATITHGDHDAGVWLDPAPVIVAAAKHAGLAYLDHVALLEAPVRDGRLTISPAPAAGPLTPVRAHADLYLFTRPASRRETSDE